MTPLSPRKKQILYAIVSEFVATGEPVGSRTLSKRGIDLSPATIRNELADLEEAGLLRQPHTSAGRVPTDGAFRVFVDALMELRQLTVEEHAKIRHHVEEVEPGLQGLRETGKFLAELTGTAAIVVATRSDTLTLKHLRFIRTVPGELLAVFVMSDGTVQNRFIPVEIDELELHRIHNLLDDVIEGRTLGDLRAFFAERMGAERVLRDALRKRAYEIAGAAMEGAGGAPVVDVVIEGRHKLLQRPEFSQGSEMHKIVAALDEETQIVALLDAAAAARGTAIFVGKEAGDLADGQLAIVGASYAVQHRVHGSVGVIGPTRMDYPSVVPLVTATAHAMSEARTKPPKE